jgi:putative heme-binding domain-containing protein
VGPDLEALSNKSNDFLLTAILDPNRAVESSFLEYYVETTQGRQFSGILRGETASAVTLLAPEAKEWTILRRDIEGMQATGKSLMPEGMEKDITVEQMQHLLAFLTSYQPVRKQFAGNEPRVAPRRDDGSVRLLAMHAEIYGPTLVFEPHYRNLGYWGSPLDYAAWTVEVPSEGEYTVSVHYACDHAAAGNRFLLLAADDQLSAEVESTGTWDDYRGRSVGKIRVPAGQSRIMLRSEGPLNAYLMDLQQIVLIPID